MQKTASKKTMEIISDYTQYINKIKNNDLQFISSGEVNTLKIFCTERDNFPKRQSYILYSESEKCQSTLLKVTYDGELLQIVAGISIKKTLRDISLCLGIDESIQAMRWWNLCYYRDEHGLVHYDSYYDRFFAADETENKLSDLHKELGKWMDPLFTENTGTIYLLGDLSECNPVIYLLQQKGLDVRTINTDISKDVSDSDDLMIKYRNRLAVPYGNGERVTISHFTSDDISHSPALCQHSYTITVPIDLVALDDVAVGNCTYKDIIPEGEFCRDYTSCGHEYCYIEMELFADLHGNTILKTTNSKTQSKYTIINKFNYINLLEDGQTN